MSLFGWLTGADDAADKANAALKKSTKLAKEGYGEVSGLYQPYREGGGGAYADLLDLAGVNGMENRNAMLGTFQTSPGYDFRMQEGVNAIDRSAAARGGLYSGATGKALTEYGQGLASGEYNNWYNNWSELLKGLANTGLAATGATADARNQLTQTASGNATQAGQNSANASLAGGNFLQNLLLTGLSSALPVGGGSKQPGGLW